MDSQAIVTLGSSAISAISALAAAAIAGYFGYKSVKATSDEAKLKEELAKLKKELVGVYRQVAAYHQLEQELSSHISQSADSSVRAIKTEFRNKVRELLGERPELSRNSAESRIRELEI
jgi:hypothetical protein